MKFHQQYLDHYIYEIISDIEKNTCIKFNYVFSPTLPPPPSQKDALCYLPNMLLIRSVKILKL